MTPNERRAFVSDQLDNIAFLELMKAYRINPQVWYLRDWWLYSCMQRLENRFNSSHAGRKLAGAWTSLASRHAGEVMILLTTTTDGMLRDRAL